MPVRAEGDDLRLECPGGIELPLRRPSQRRVGSSVTFMIRPENIALQAGPPAATGSRAWALQGTIAHLVDRGPVVAVTVACGREWELLVSLGKTEYNRLGLGPGDPVRLCVQPEAVHVLQDD